MSFFGFNSSASRPPAPVQSYDFQETYEGLGEIDDADDALNDETFGVANVGKNFDFGHVDAPPPPAAAPAPSSVCPELSFAQAAVASDDDFIKDLWGYNTVEQAGTTSTRGAVPTSAGSAEMSGGRKILSLEEIEALLTTIDPSAQHCGSAVAPMPQQPQQQQFYPGMPTQYGAYMVPQGFMMPMQQYAMPYPSQFMPAQSMTQQMPGMPPVPVPTMYPTQPALIYPQGSLGQAATLAGVAPTHNTTAQPQSQQPRQSPPRALDPAAAAQSPSAAQRAVSGTKETANISQFPVLGASLVQAQHANVHHEQKGAESHVSHARQHQALEDLLPEEQYKLDTHQEKVSRIMQYCGVMNPKDKDFVTRFQLSQIVTDDPYNEDFYAQVYRVIHPKSAPDGSVMPVSHPNSIAQAYLDQSGHRLGGRLKRADVALQRMQQQVQKAVTVAKERQKLPQHVREGVLGKVSVGSGKKPRQQLVILSKAAQKAKEIEDSEDGEGQAQVKSSISPSIVAPSKPIKRYIKKDIMSILEDIISNLMAVESASRTSNNVDTTKLWDSLHVMDQKSSSGDDESFVNPFIQALNYAKALKIMPRLFKFLTREQILTVVTLIMANLENLKVIKDGSYTTYPERKVPEPVTKLVDMYTLTFCKVLMNAVQEFNFTEIVSLLLILIRQNVLSFVSTTKIGLSVVTSLLSRAELMNGEGQISATDLLAWTSCYDELFTALESRIAAIFAPSHGDTEDDYVWQFLATLSLGGKLSHQRIIVDEVRDEIFGVMNRAKALDCSISAKLYKKQNMLNNLNMYLVVMGLVADENEIQELKT
ncbi:hypothetical protein METBISCDRAFT_21802 [Metschnikowia bicuspidata]|uniref:mRNA decay factor PAT1 domain-containing protein n=1 Tax=Metschnikowia bicuspidata TaxID=27322 RepID=A0A4P9ZG65_9ASCO|nr:hypothetical protein METBISCDRAFT_21802 [Metschnikowia bicuspidata]